MGVSIDKWVAVGFSVLAVLCGVVVALQPELSTGLVVVALLMGLTLLHPQLGIAIWLICVIAIPSWTLIPAAGTAIGPSYLALPIILALLVRRAHDRLNGAALRLTLVDAVVVLGVLLVLAFQFVYGQEQFLATNVLITLFGGYVMGRLAEQPIQKLFVVAMVTVAVWGILEFLFGLHLFTEWQAGAGGIGPALQDRGGFTRSEASLGHAIAYGACLVAAVPFTRQFSRPVVLQIILALGVLVSFSRGPMIALVVTFAVMLYVERSAGRRTRSAVVLGIGIVVIYYIFDLLYSGSGQAELASSTYHRDIQISRSLDFINWIGPADGAQLNSEGRYVTNGIDIIDSVPLRLGLDFGWIVVCLLLLPVGVAAVRVLLRLGGQPSVAVVGQIPVITVTSFITQWQIIFMFICGLAVSELVRGEATSDKGTESARSALKGIPYRPRVGEAPAAL